MTVTTDQPLTNKQKVFVEEYLSTWNATRSAERAGYKGTYIALKNIGSRLLKKPHIAAAIQARLKEKAMPADENLARLAEQGRVSIADFIFDQVNEGVDKDGNLYTVHSVGIDWEAVQARGHLVKSIKPTAAGIAIELHDSQRALELIAKHLGLLANVHLIDTKHGGKIELVEMTLEQWEQRQAAQRQQANQILETFGPEEPDV